jgi:hypothetical protein
VLNVAWERGLTVRGELSVLAHADSQLAEYSVPPLTAVRMPLGELGAEAVTALVVQIQTGASQDVLVGAAPRLEVRASTARPLTKPVRAFGPRSGGRGRPAVRSRASARERDRRDIGASPRFAAQRPLSP